jgi:Arc/MetJ-type ribon-helix-helix transcriptional regulator
MVRTQIQLTEEQARLLHEIATREGVSMAEIIRQSVDKFIQDQSKNKRWEQVERAKEAAGKYHAEVKDLAKNHNLYLTEDLDK